METKFEIMIREIREFFTDMETSDKVFLVLYGVLFLAIGLLFEFEVLAKPGKIGELLSNPGMYEYYIVAYAVISISNIVIVVIAAIGERGLKNQWKGYFNGEVDYYYGYKEKFTLYSFFGSVLSLMVMILINSILFNTFIVINMVVLGIIAFMVLFVSQSRSSSRRI